MLGIYVLYTQYNINNKSILLLENILHITKTIGNTADNNNTTIIKVDVKVYVTQGFHICTRLASDT